MYLVRTEQQVPAHHRGADVHRKWQARFRSLFVHRLDALHEIGIERIDVLVRHVGIGHIGHGGIEVRTVA
ncbi:hypothetical protein D3C87_2138780 [compost metagenome]